MTTSNDQQFKADAGKLQARLLFEGMPKSLLMITAVLSYGAQKYEAHSWKKVSPERYEDAKMRHYLDDKTYGGCDEESNLLHKAHEACNTLFLLEQYLDTFTPEEFQALLKFNKPPTEHKK